MPPAANEKWRNEKMTDNEKYDYDTGRVGAELMKNARMQRDKRIAELNAKAEHINTFPIYCERSVCERLERVKNMLAKKNLLAKFNGQHYAIFVLDFFERTQITDYSLTLEQVEDFAENA